MYIYVYICLYVYIYIYVWNLRSGNLVSIALMILLRIASCFINGTESAAAKRWTGIPKKEPSGTSEMGRPLSLRLLQGMAASLQTLDLRSWMHQLSCGTWLSPALSTSGVFQITSAMTSRVQIVQWVPLDYHWIPRPWRMCHLGSFHLDDRHHGAFLAAFLLGTIYERIWEAMGKCLTRPRPKWKKTRKHLKISEVW